MDNRNFGKSEFNVSKGVLDPLFNILLKSEGQGLAENFLFQFLFYESYGNANVEKLVINETSVARKF